MNKVTDNIVVILAYCAGIFTVFGAETIIETGMMTREMSFSLAILLLAFLFQNTK